MPFQRFEELRRQNAFEPRSSTAILILDPRPFDGDPLVKSIHVMTTTPFVARFIGLDNPRAAVIFGGVMGMNSRAMAGLAATDPKLVPYGAMTATFYTELGCIVGPSIAFFAIKSIVGSPENSNQLPGIVFEAVKPHTHLALRAIDVYFLGRSQVSPRW